MISVVVFSYNSEDTVIETLESIKNQSYKDIELVISDDCSSDGTLTKIQSWCDYNRNRFTNVVIHQNKKNLGITKHFKIGLSLANGEWIKDCAADDVLLGNCLEVFFDYVSKHPDSEYIISSMYLYNGGKKWPMSGNMFMHCKKVGASCGKKQTKLLMMEDTKVSATHFFSRNILTKYGTGESPIRNLEDWPFRLNMSLKGCNIIFIEKPTVMYRVNNTSISHSSDLFFRPEHVAELIKLKELLIYGHKELLGPLYYWNEKVENTRYRTIIKLGNKRSPILKLLNIFFLMLEPYSYVKGINGFFGDLYIRNKHIFEENE